MHEQYQDAYLAHQRASLAALETGDPLAVIQTRIAQANTLQALGRIPEAMQTLRRATLLQEQIAEQSVETMRIRAHLLACYADQVFSLHDRIQAQRLLDEAASVLEEIPPAEEFDRASWLQLAGKHALECGEAKRAVDFLQQALNCLPSTSLLRRTFILLPLAVAFARLREHEVCLNVLNQLETFLSATYLPRVRRLAIQGGEAIREAFPKDHAIQAAITALQTSSGEVTGAV
jgi:tetratricopeptide (TPR) repeat protein